MIQNKNNSIKFLNFYLDFETIKTPRQERNKPKKSKEVNVSSNIKKASKAETGGTKKIKKMSHLLYY